MDILGYIVDSIRLSAGTRRHVDSWLRAALPFLLVLSGAYSVNAETLTESKVKSAFLYNFAKFVKWPPNSLADPTAPFTFCTIGDNPLQGTLDEVLQGKTLDDHPLLSRHLGHASDAKGCQVLFVSESASSGSKNSLTSLRLPGLLVVGEFSNKRDVSKEGAMITFVLESNRVRFVIDTKAAGQAGLTISSRLLSLALAVEK